MRSNDRDPSQIARRMAARIAASPDRKPISDGWRRESFTLDRDAAREKAREWFARFPKAAYMTEVESWRELDDGRIEFTMRRLPTAD